jgi:hypothetical protein
MHSPQYRSENVGALLGDWPRIPMPATAHLLADSATLGRRLADLLDARENESPHMTAAIPESRPVTEEISAVIECVTFHNDENGFCVLRVKTKGHREETTVVGSLPSVTAGEWLAAEGWWVRD